MVAEQERGSIEQWGKVSSRFGLVLELVLEKGALVGQFFELFLQRLAVLGPGVALQKLSRSHDPAVGLFGPLQQHSQVAKVLGEAAKEVGCQQSLFLHEIVDDAVQISHQSRRCFREHRDSGLAFGQVLELQRFAV